MRISSTSRIWLEFRIPFRVWPYTVTVALARSSQGLFTRIAFSRANTAARRVGDACLALARVCAMKLSVGATSAPVCRRRRDPSSKLPSASASSSYLKARIKFCIIILLIRLSRSAIDIVRRIYIMASVKERVCRYFRYFRSRLSVILYNDEQA